MMEQLSPHSIGYSSPMTTYAGYDVNPAYMTPSYMSNFRPAYKGVNTPYAESIIDTGADTFNSGLAGALQYGAIPLASWYAANKMFGRTGIAEWAGRRLGGAMAGGLNAGMANTFGRIGGIRNTAAASSMGSALMTGARGLGAFLGGPALVMGGAALATSALEKGGWNSYHDTRSGMNMMRDNVRNIYTGEGRGGLKGVSLERAHELSSKFTRMGVDDYRFDQGDFQEIADLSMRSGILNEHLLLDKNDIVKAVKQTTDMVKLISDITGDKDFQKSIDYIAKLKRGGIAGASVASAMGELQNASAISGISIDQLIDTVGTQGQLAYQRAGLMPGQGLLNSSKTYSGFVNAFRSGLISNSQMATLGGVDGATQRLSEGAIATGTDHFSVLMGMTGENSHSSALSRFNSFGNPVAALGNMYLNRGAYSQRYMEGKSEGGVILSKLIADARATHGDNVKIDANMIGAMAQMSGLDPITVQAALMENQARRSFSGQVNESGARGAGNLERYMNYAEDEGIDNSGNVFGRMFDSARAGARHFLKEAGDETGTSLAGLTAKFQDDAYKFINIDTLGVDKNKSFMMGKEMVSLEVKRNAIKKTRGQKGLPGTTSKSWEVADDQKLALHKLQVGLSSSDAKTRAAAIKAYNKALAGDYKGAMYDFNLATDGSIYGTTDEYDVKDMQAAHGELRLEKSASTDTTGIGTSFKSEWDGIDIDAMHHLRKQLGSGASLSKMARAYTDEYISGSETSAKDVISKMLGEDAKRKKGESESEYRERLSRAVNDNFRTMRKEGILDTTEFTQWGADNEIGSFVHKWGNRAIGNDIDVGRDYRTNAVMKYARSAGVDDSLLPYFKEHSEGIFSGIRNEANNGGNVDGKLQDFIRLAEASLANKDMTFDIAGVEEGLIDVGKDMKSLSEIVGSSQGLNEQFKLLHKTIQSINSSRSFQKLNDTLEISR